MTILENSLQVQRHKMKVAVLLYHQQTKQDDRLVMRRFSLLGPDRENKIRESQGKRFSNFLLLVQPTKTTRVERVMKLDPVR
jgi:hypothetical protein